ncbi:hypothetical protein MSHO_17120 [Mycobacterium shottsii]|uniref:PE family protein n=1 Tax=Mycobacterium shottsii TaxID=133549 RepID=A0A7I7L9Q6_9MYCO|nr:hypothetical protein MSHO_17120 [Mycobacterium shottsii]
MWFIAISGSGGVAASASACAAACANACVARAFARAEAVANQLTIGTAAAIARSPLSPLHTSPADFSRADTSMACASRAAAQSFRPVATASIDVDPAPAINRAVLSSGGIACHSMMTPVF